MGRLFGAGNINIGPEGFETVVSCPVDKKNPGVRSQKCLLKKRLVEYEKPRLKQNKTKNQCVETQEGKEGKCVRGSLKGRAKSNYPN